MMSSSYFCEKIEGERERERERDRERRKSVEKRE